jgi:hypothetical protein
MAYAFIQIYGLNQFDNFHAQFVVKQEQAFALRLSEA